MKPLSSPAALAIAVLLSAGSAATIPGDEATVLHVLGRAGFGARPGEVEKIRTVGIQRYLDEQLHPEKIADADVERRLANLETLRMSSAQLADTYGPNAGGARPDANRPMVELAEQKLLRAVYSERQLQEVLVDFWFNHFNVDARKGPDRFLLPEYEREAIRPHVLGKFRDLLGASAKSPAMLFYLDNWMSADPNGPHVEQARQEVPRRPAARLPILGAGAANRQKPARGLNENYGRELMELHTIGVDGGYTQKDVTEVARCFTGWTIQDPRQGGGFRFDARMHDPGEKVVLGHVIKPGGGESDGEQVLDILARHRSTARFIATKLARRFVSDVPPAALVDRAAARFRQTDGDLREVTRTILLSPEFLSTRARGIKAKSPFEFVVSALRAAGAEIDDAAPLVRMVQQLGMPLYACQPPTGYKDTVAAWMNAGALVSRMNVAIRLAAAYAPQEAGRETLALTLGSPAFQRR